MTEGPKARDKESTTDTKAIRLRKTPSVSQPDERIVVSTPSNNNRPAVQNHQGTPPVKTLPGSWVNSSGSQGVRGRYIPPWKQTESRPPVVENAKSDDQVATKTAIKFTQSTPASSASVASKPLGSSDSLRITPSQPKYAAGNRVDEGGDDIQPLKGRSANASPHQSEFKVQAWSGQPAPYTFQSIWNNHAVQAQAASTLSFEAFATESHTLLTDQGDASIKVPDEIAARWKLPTSTNHLGQSNSSPARPQIRDTYHSKPSPPLLDYFHTSLGGSVPAKHKNIWNTPPPRTQPVGVSSFGGSEIRRHTPATEDVASSEVPHDISWILESPVPTYQAHDLKGFGLQSSSSPASTHLSKTSYSEPFLPLPHRFHTPLSGSVLATHKNIWNSPAVHLPDNLDVPEEYEANDYSQSADLRLVNFPPDYLIQGARGHGFEEQVKPLLPQTSGLQSGQSQYYSHSLTPFGHGYDPNHMMPHSSSSFQNAGGHMLKGQYQDSRFPQHHLQEYDVVQQYSLVSDPNVNSDLSSQYTPSFQAHQPQGHPAVANPWVPPVQSPGAMLGNYIPYMPYQHQYPGGYHHPGAHQNPRALPPQIQYGNVLVPPASESGQFNTPYNASEQDLMIYQDHVNMNRITQTN